MKSGEGSVAEYSDTLRALGRFLEMIGASEISIVEEREHVQVTWHGRGNAREERRYKDFEIQALRTTARLLRGLEGGTPRFTTSEMLRTLGRDLDEMSARRIGLVETNDGFYVSAEVDGERIGRSYTLSELIARALESHEHRLTEQAGPADQLPEAAVCLPALATGSPRRSTTPLLTRLAS